MPRVQVTTEHLEIAETGIAAALRSRIHEKGTHSFGSSHEVLGLLVEERGELEAAIVANDRDAIKSELRDIIVAATWGLASEIAGGWDW